MRIFPFVGGKIVEVIGKQDNIAVWEALQAQKSGGRFRRQFRP
jgi:hypothetical protein